MGPQSMESYLYKTLNGSLSCIPPAKWTLLYSHSMLCFQRKKQWPSLSFMHQLGNLKEASIFSKSPCTSSCRGWWLCGFTSEEQCNFKASFFLLNLTYLLCYYVTPLHTHMHTHSLEYARLSVGFLSKGYTLDLGLMFKADCAQVCFAYDRFCF